MKNSLPCLSALVVHFVCTGATAQNSGTSTAAAARSAAPQAPAAETAPAGDRLLVQAINQFERHKSLTARLRHQVSIGGAQLYGVGSYWQQGSGESLRVRLELKIAAPESKLLQVSNSRFLWVDRQLPTGRTVTRVDLRQLRADPVLSAGDLESIQPGEASWSPIQPELTAHCGGLSSLLAALGDNFSFLPPQAMQLALEPPLVPQPMKIPVLAVVGHWKPEKLAELTKDGAGLRVEGRGSEAEHTLPERLPQEVLLLVGQADLFPYRIEYRRLETACAASATGPTIPYQLSADPQVVLELSDVTFDVPIEGGQFDYTPPDVEWVDQTAKLLERLRKQRRSEVAARGSAEQAR